MKAVHVSLALMGAIGFVTACGSFLSADDPDAPGPDAFADAPVDVATNDTNADATDAGDASTCTVFEDDFTGGDTTDWEPVTPKCVEAGAAPITHDGGNVGITLGCFVKELEGYQVLEKGPYSTLVKTNIAFAFKIGLADSHVFMQLLHFFGAYGANLSLVAVPDQIQLWDRKGGAMLTSWSTPDQTVWRSIHVELTPKDANASSLHIRATLDGTTRDLDIQRDLDGGMNEFRVQLGPYANVGAGDFQDAYDDVRITTCP